MLVRFLTSDDETQAGQVYRVFRKAESEETMFFIPLLVVIELIWVLESVYEIARNDILDSLTKLLQMPIFKFEHADALQPFIRSARNSRFDLPDLLIGESARIQGCDAVLTFDRKASKSALFERLG